MFSLLLQFTTHQVPAKGNLISLFACQLPQMSWIVPYLLPSAAVSATPCTDGEVRVVRRLAATV